jgi:hypothetical protein
MHITDGTQIPHHIYITTDVEIEEGDKGWLLENNDITKNINQYDCTNGLGGIYPTDKKIVLTTDQYLIKDGVQAIDDEFLEWFVNNPSCESVKVTKVDTFKKTNEVYVDEITVGNYYEVNKQYKIIIPREEPKPHSFCETPDEKCTMKYCDENGCQNRKRELVEPQEEPKQLTDLEIAIKLEEIEREEWQSERMYSEEDMIEFGKFCYSDAHSVNRIKTFKELFEQFKKK